MSAAYFQHRNRISSGTTPVVVDAPTSHPSFTYSLLLPQASTPACTLASNMRVMKTLASGINADLLLVKYLSGTPHAPSYPHSQTGSGAVVVSKPPPAAQYGAVKRFKVPVSTLSRNGFILLSKELRLLGNTNVVGVPHITTPHPNVLRPREVWIDNSVRTVDSQGTILFVKPLQSTITTTPPHPLHLCVLYDHQGPSGGKRTADGASQLCSCGINTHIQTTLEDAIRSGVLLEAFLVRSLLFQALCGLKHLHGYVSSSSATGVTDKTPRALYYTPHADITPRNLSITYEKWDEEAMVFKDEQSTPLPMVQPHRDGYAHVVRISYMYSALGDDGGGGGVEPYPWEWLHKEGPPEVYHHHHSNITQSHSRSETIMPPTPQSDIWALGACMLALVSQDNVIPPIYPRSHPASTLTSPTATSPATETILANALSAVGNGYSRKVSAVLGAMLSPHLLNRPSAQRLLQYYPLFVGTHTSSERCAGVAKGVRSVVRRLERNNTNSCNGVETVRVVLAPILGFTLPTALPVKQVPLLESTTVGWVEWGSNIAVEATATSAHPIKSTTKATSHHTTTTNPTASSSKPLRTPYPPPQDEEDVSTLTMIQFRGREAGEGWLKVIAQDQMGNHFVMGYVPASLEGSCDHSEDGAQRYELFQICASTTLEHVRRRRHKATTQEVLLQSLGISSSTKVDGREGGDDPDASFGSIQTSSMGSALEFMSLIAGSASLSGTFGGGTVIPATPVEALPQPSKAVTDGRTKSRVGEFTPPPLSITSNPSPPPLHLPPSSAQAAAASLHPTLNDNDEAPRPRHNSSLSSLEGDVDRVTAARLSPHWDVFSTLSPDDKDITASRCCSNSSSSRNSTPSREAIVEEGECPDYNNRSGGGEGPSPHHAPHSARG